VDEHKGYLTTWDELEQMEWPDPGKADTRAPEWYEEDLPVSASQEAAIASAPATAWPTTSPWTTTWQCWRRAGSTAEVESSAKRSRCSAAMRGGAETRPRVAHQGAGLVEQMGYVVWRNSRICVANFGVKRADFAKSRVCSTWNIFRLA